MTDSVLATRVFGVGGIDWGLLNVEFAVEYLSVVRWRRQAVLLIDEQVRELEARGLPGWGVSTWGDGGSQRGVNYWLVSEYIREHSYEFLGSSMGDFPVGGDVGAVLMKGVRLGLNPTYVGKDILTMLNAQITTASHVG